MGAAVHPSFSPLSFGRNNLFLVSLPGSLKDTVRELLGSAAEIQAEHEDPWFMLPLLYQRRDTGSEAEYNHTKARTRTAQFLASVPEGELRYTEELRRFATTLYSTRLEGRHRYVLDASDRYYYIISQLKALLPEARFIFLLGNPLDPLRDVLQDKFRGYFPALYEHDDIYRDIYIGPKALAEGVKNSDAQCFSLRESDLNNESTLPRTLAHLSSWLGLDTPLEPKTWNELRDNAKYVTAAGLPPRPRRPIDAAYVDAALKYLEHLGEDTLAVLGYDKGTLQRHLFSEYLTPVAQSLVDNLPRDIVEPLYGDGANLLSQLMNVTLAENEVISDCSPLPPEVPHSLRSQIAEAVVWLGEERFAEGNETGAHDAFRAAVGIDSTCTRASSNLAVILHQRGEIQAALELLFQSHTANPDDALILANLCALLKEMGKVAEGRQLAMNFLSSHPDNTEAMSIFIDMN